MAKLTITNETGYTEQYQLAAREFVMGRQADTDLRLDARDVSRRHARILADGEQFFLEDLGSSNGTFVNNCRVQGRTELREQDRIQIGPFTLRFQGDEEAPESERSVIIRATEQANVSNTKLFKLDAARKLQVVLEIAQSLARSLDIKELLPQLLDRLLRLFVQADRGTILMLVDGQPQVRAVRDRYPDQETPAGYSRSVVKQVLDEGVGIVAEDASIDDRFNLTQTLAHLGIRSFVCVPFKAHDGRPLGAVILDRFGGGNPFTEDDLHLLTAITLHASVVFENAAMHAELMAKARLERDVALARQIQEGFLPSELPANASGFVELFARVCPAQEIAGDFYDFFPVGDRQLAFAVADIAGKGVPAALLMTGIRTLSRHLAQAQQATPAQVLQQINDMLAQDNPQALFVTMAMGLLDLATGELLIASGGHPPALVRRAGGAVEQVAQPTVRLLGYAPGILPLADTRLRLEAEDALVLYTDGVTEARSHDRQGMFGVEGLTATLRDLSPGQPLEGWGRRVRSTLDRYTNRAAADDDVTLLFLRRLPGVALPAAAQLESDTHTGT